ncbi:MAG: BON domain-containing protein [Chloroflexi bacterium]|nr:BON domain-containing protein [Chloroflexota bacterium]
MKSDAQIQQDVLRELKWDSRVEETDVGVEVDRGVVTLTGTVESYAKKLAAQEAAHRVHGVLDVANDIEVKARGTLAPTDEELAHVVRHALQWHVIVPDERIHTTVAHGWVTLEGTVEHLYQREDAERAVSQLRGVRGVRNHIEVDGRSVSEDTVRQAIEAALERRAEREAKRIVVSVKDGTVTLSGPVHSWMEKQAVLGAARFAPGVRQIDDHLRIVINA